jgi:integrase
VRLRAGGAARWIFQYRIGAKQRRVSLGTTSAISASRARESAGELHARVKLGEDVAGHKAQERQRAVETLGAVLDTYLVHKRTHLKPRSLVEIERHLHKHCRPLHGLRLDKIDRRAVAGRIAALAAKSGVVAANRTRASLAAFFAWAIREGLANNNPVVGTGSQPERTRDRVLGNDELRAIWAATADNSDYSAVVRLLMLSGMRAAEVAGLKFSEITGEQIVLEPARTKNKRRHVVPITDPMRAILDGRPRRPGRDLIFGRRHDRPLTGWSVLKAALDQRLGAAVAGWTHHDLRRTCATRLGELDIPPHVVAAVLGHVSDFRGGVHGIYDRSTLEPQKRHALTVWGEHLLALVEGRAVPSTVVSLRA